MTLHDQYKAGVANARHVLIIGPTKSGKSDWVAQTAKDGFHVVYVDNDNGMGTLIHQLKDDPEAMKRVHYFNPPDMAKFVENFLTLGVFRWNMTQNVQFTSASAKPDDQCVEIFPSKLPANLVLSIDTWTALSFSALKAAAKGQNIDMGAIDSSGLGRELYGPAGLKLTYIATIIQHAPFHVIVQAHPAVYEMKEKPTGGRVSEVKEKDMIIKSVTDIPQSSSGPHGFNLGKHFGEIGWLSVGKNMGKRELDFEVKAGRISGGSVTGKGDPRKTHSFANLFFSGNVPSVDISESIVYFTGADFASRNASGVGAAPAKVSGSGNGQQDNSEVTQQPAQKVTIPNSGAMRGIKLGGK